MRMRNETKLNNEGENVKILKRNAKLKEICCREARRGQS